MKKELKWKKILRNSVLGTILVGLTVFGIGFYIDQKSTPYRIELDSAPPADAVMILGAFVSKDGNPSWVLQDRLEYGYLLYREGKAKKFLVTGDHGTPEYDEVNGMKNYLLAKGVPAEDIFLDHAGFDTYDSMYRAKEIFQVETLLISTQDFHMNRSLYIARQLGLDAYGFASPDRAEYRMGYLRFREAIAKVKAFMNLHIWRPKPIFLGSTIPINGDGRVTDDTL